MKKKLVAFTINTLDQAEQVILESKIYKIKPILHLKYYMLRGFGSDFILNFEWSKDRKAGVFRGCLLTSFFSAF